MPCMSFLLLLPLRFVSLSESVLPLYIAHLLCRIVTYRVFLSFIYFDAGDENTVIQTNIGC